jgi:hypothetical protein
MLRGWCVLLALLVAATPAAAQEGRLERVREETGGHSDSSHGSGGGSGCDPGLDDALAGLIGPVFLYALAGPFVVPHAALGDNFDVDATFPSYPYPDGHPGYLWLGRVAGGEASDAGEYHEPAGQRGWSVRLALEDGNDFRGLNRLGGSLVLDTTSRFGLRADWNYYRERLACGCVDETTLGDLNLTYRFAQHEMALFYAGVGFRALADSSTSRFGFNFLYGADFFPVWPFVVSTSFDLGDLGSAFVVHGRGTAGVVWRNWELFGGYDFLRVGSVNLQGPLLGVRFWF